MTALKRKPKPFPREVVELQARVRELSELIEDDWSAAFKRNQSATFQARLDLLMERDRLVARIRAILDQPPPRPPVRDQVIGLLQLVGFAVAAFVGCIAASLLGFAALQWLAATPLVVGLLLVLLWMGLCRD